MPNIKKVLIVEENNAVPFDPRVWQETIPIHEKVLLCKHLYTADAALSPEPCTPLSVHSTFIKIGEILAMANKSWLVISLSRDKPFGNQLSMFSQGTYRDMDGQL